MEKILIPIIILILVTCFAACATTGAGAERGRVINRTDADMDDLYWTVHYSCKGRTWSTIGYSDVGRCGERHHIVKLDRKGNFKIPSAIFITMLLEPNVDRSCALRHRDQENAIYFPVRILNPEIYNKTFSLILEKKAFTFTFDARMVSRILAILKNNGYNVDEDSSVILTYSLSYHDDQEIYDEFYRNSFGFTFKELQGQSTISSTGYIARPDINGRMKETFKLEINTKNNSWPRFEYQFSNDISSNEFARTVSLSPDSEKLVASFNKLIVQRGANSLLAGAVNKGDLTAAKKALRHGADPRCREGHEDNDVPVFWRAVQRQNYSIIKLLIDAGADINIKWRSDDTPIGEAFFQADYNRDTGKPVDQKKAERIIELLLSHGARVEHDTELMWKACQLHRFDFITLLVKNGADLNYLLRGKDRRDKLIPLHRAACCENPKTALPIIDFLLRKGVPVDIRDDEGRTALHSAMRSNVIFSSPQQLDVIKKLVSYGADVNAIDNEGNTPLHTLAQRTSLYHLAWLRGLKRDPSKIKEAEAAIAPFVSFLAKKGADLNVLNKGGNTPLHCCAEKNNSETALALIKNGTNIDRLTSGPGYSSGYSALHLAGYRTSLETMMILAENGADLNLKTPEGKTIFDIALSHDHPDNRMKNYLQKFNRTDKSP